MKVTDHPQVNQGGFAPADGSLPPPEQPRPDTDVAKARKSAKIRALVVDDELISRELLCRLLRSETDIELAGTASNGRSCSKPESSFNLCLLREATSSCMAAHYNAP